jgi:hypothetical protein
VVYVELAEYACEVSLDCLGRDEELLADLTVGVTVGGQSRDSALGGGERVTAGLGVATRAGTGQEEFCAGAGGKGPGAAGVRQTERASQRVSCGGAVACTSQVRAEFTQRPGSAPSRPPPR